MDGARWLETRGRSVAGRGAPSRRACAPILIPRMCTARGGRARLDSADVPRAARAHLEFADVGARGARWRSGSWYRRSRHVALARDRAAHVARAGRVRVELDPDAPR